MILGWLGLGLLLASYAIRLTKYKESFRIIACISSIILTVHALAIGDAPFTIVNGVIAIILIVEIKQTGGWRKWI